MNVLLFGGIPAGPELLILVGVVVLLFGADKIPALARATGESLGEFKKGRKESEKQIRDEIQDTEEDH